MSEAKKRASYSEFMNLMRKTRRTGRGSMAIFAFLPVHGYIPLDIKHILRQVSRP